VNDASEAGNGRFCFSILCLFSLFWKDLLSLSLLSSVLRFVLLFPCPFVITPNCGNASHLQSPFAGQQAGKNSLVGMTLRPPFLFARLFFAFAKKIFQKVMGLKNKNEKNP